MTTYPSNLSIGDQLGSAIIVAAQKKNAAASKRKQADRILDAFTINATGGSHELRKAKARQTPEYIAADNDAMQAEHDANIAKANADALQITWETWRTEQATYRAQMNLR